MDTPSLFPLAEAAMTQTGVHRILLSCAVLATFGATAWWAARGDSPAAALDARAPIAASFAAGTSVPRDPMREEAGAMPGTAAGQTGDAAEATFSDYVAGKYAALLREPTLPLPDRARLLDALLARERIAVALNTARQGADAAAQAVVPAREAELAALDVKLASLLRPAEYAAFEMLRHSDMEQFQLDDYAGGIRNVAPLSESDRQTILRTKLVHRQRFRRVLEESGLMRGGLGAAERRFAFDSVSRALGDSRRDFLAEARQYLYDDMQYALLSNYENSEYAAELAKLRSIAYGDGS
jgi:hypothetical protein